MKHPAMTSLVLLTAAAAALAGNSRLEHPVGEAPSSSDLTYFDGTAWWLSWDGLYRGTWFHMQDFYPSPVDFELRQSEMWFYHHASYPWDTSEVWFEVFNGDQMAPVEQLDRTLVTAAHYSAVEVDYGAMFFTEPDFWLIANTEVSSGGWPSILGDSTPNETDHSFHSDDFIVWEPWVIQGPTANDYWIQAEGPLPGFESATWGAVKTLF